MFFSRGSSCVCKLCLLDGLIRVKRFVWGVGRHEEGNEGGALFALHGCSLGWGLVSIYMINGDSLIHVVPYLLTL
jgi:hypothetical protein